MKFIVSRETMVNISFMVKTLNVSRETIRTNELH